ncbi:VWA domain-containing protein [Rhodococcus sp. TAF43]|uniref:VWA domain-containing protein n=1 Tax=Rhodococcus sp. TAF43 TaxID=3237483 RepID=UPI003F9D62D5
MCAGHDWQASALPAFWQFTGICKNERTILDTRAGHVVDSAGLITLDAIDAGCGSELCQRLPGALPDWPQAARSA